VLLDEEAAAMLDEQSGARGGGFGVRGSGPLDGRTSFALPGQGQVVGYGDAGGASRFFYVAKPSRAERDAGLDGMPPTKNHHPTVKPVALMRWLVRLVTPPGGVVLDPFTGSGTTGVAAVLEGFRFLGFEVSEQYAEIARRRIEHAAAEAA
jgi:site-specific DNA-methyltransferase (adenine-specific)